MSNRLTMAEIDTILTLRASGHSNRAIAELLGLDRGTVGKYVARGDTIDRTKLQHVLAFVVAFARIGSVYPKMTIGTP